MKLHPLQTPLGKLNSERSATSCSNLGSRIGGSTEYIFGVYHTVETPFEIWATALSGSLFGSTYMFSKKGDSSTPK